MKKTIMMLVMMIISLATFAQKNELKAADKAIKSNDYASAKTAIEQYFATSSCRGIKKYKSKNKSTQI